MHSLLHKDAYRLSFTGGMCAGCFSTLGNNPFDVVKTQMQSSGAAAKYKSTADCFRQIFAAEGLQGFYKGVVPRMGRVVPGQVATDGHAFVTLMNSYIP